jgi:Protein of unknown function (DUF1302)
MSTSHLTRSTFLPALKLSALAVGLAIAGGASAAQFKFDSGISGSFDSTFSYGLSIRTQDPDKSLIGLANGGTSRSVNEDDGTRNYKKNSPFANVLKGTHELSAKWEDWGLLVRGTYFVDFANRNNDKLGPIAKDRVGSDARILDAFITKSFDLAGKNVRVRAGNQVISWGESTFIPGGINVINSVDLVKLRTPGSELKEAFLPTSSIWTSFELTKNASLEAFVQFNHDKTKIDPRGSYWSNNDFASDDSDRVFVGFGRRGDLTRRAPANIIPPTLGPLYTASQALYGNFDPAAQVWAPRGADRTPSDNGQYGLAFRYLASDFNNTEFGLYYLNYHSRIPFFSGIKGLPTSVITGGPLTASICGIGAPAAALCQQALPNGAPNPAGVGASSLPVGAPIVKASYFAEYPENIRLMGFSFNTQGPFGVALQGEYSYRPNQPLQYSTPELLLAALGAPNLTTGFTQLPAPAPVGATAAALVPDGTFQRGWDRVKMSQFQMTATKSIPSILGAEQVVMVGEFGYTKYHGLNNSLRYNGPAVFLPATLLGAQATQSGATSSSVQQEGFITESSYGYRLVGRAEYANAFLGANFTPRIAFNHDVKGVSQTFNEGVKSVSIGANIDYQRKLSVDLSYSNFFGGRTYCGTDVAAPTQTSLAPQLAVQGASFCSSANPVKDRDFISLVVSYSF